MEIKVPVCMICKRFKRRNESVGYGGWMMCWGRVYAGEGEAEIVPSLNGIMCEKCVEKLIEKGGKGN